MEEVVSHPCLRVVTGMDGLVKLPTMEIVSTFLFFSDAEGARCHLRLCVCIFPGRFCQGLYSFISYQESVVVCP